VEPLPYRIVTERLVLRCWEPADAPLLKEAVDSSLDHLRPWMPWAHELPQPLDATVALLRTFRGRFDLGEDFVYGIFDAAEERAVGGSGLHTRLGPGALEIGYWIRADATGRGLATEAAAALARAAFAFADVDRVEIHVEPANERSLAVARRLGFAEEATLRRRLPSQPGEEPRDVVVFTLFAGEWRESPLGEVRLAAFDALGRPLG
jgi:RimJ/RimL family protein N-acetyltransferase